MEMVPHEQVLESMRLFAKEVMPKFQSQQDRDQAVWAPTKNPLAAPLER